MNPNITRTRVLYPQGCLGNPEDNGKGAVAMTIRITIILMFLLSIAAFSSAEIYKFRDAEGVLRFTDNLQEVPKDQRPKVESYHEIKPKAEPEKESMDEGSAKLKQDAVDRQATALHEEKMLLDSEYAKLEADKKELVELSQKEKNAEVEAAFQNKVQDFNARIKAYDEKRKTFEQKVKEYNASVP